MPPPLWNDLVLRHWRGSDAPAVIDDDGVVGGDQLLHLAAGASALFDSLGFVAGDAVPALMDESRTAIALMVGGAMSRRPLAPLGTKLALDELAYSIRELGARHVLVGPERAELGARVAGEAGVELVVLDRLEPATPLDGDCAEDDTVVVVHTSGTTGHPKPIFMRQAPMAARVAVYAEVLGIGPGDVYCSASPFHHTASVAMDTTVLGAGSAIVPQDWFSVDNWRRAGRLGVTVALLVPTMIDMLLADGSLGDAEPRVLQYGAMPIHPDTLVAAMKALPNTRFVQIFGQTEVSPVTFMSHEDHLRAVADRPDLLLCVGRAVPGVTLRIEGADDEGVGEVALRAAHACQADPDGWRRSGDLGRLDSEGFLSLQGRVNDRIIRGGENIYPVEIEVALQRHEGVREAAVVGVPDRRWGEVVKAVVVPADSASPPTVDDLRAFLSDRLAHFKLPAVIEFADELPRNAAGKILRRQLK